MTQLRITLTREDESGSIDVPGDVTVAWDADMADCSVHAWFKVFESVLGAAGYSESVIMRGACELAFNDCRDEAVMKKLSKEYDLDFSESEKDVPG